MLLKIKKREPIIINTILFVIIGLFFLHVQYAYRTKLSAFSWYLLWATVKLYWPVLPLAMLTLWATWTQRLIAQRFFSWTVCVIAFFTLTGLYIDFNKVLVLALFFLAVIAHLLYQQLKFTLTWACYQSNYLEEDLFSPVLTKIKGELKIDEETHRVTLTNWDEHGVFLYLEKPLQLSGVVHLLIHYDHLHFQGDGEVVAQSADFVGVGLKLKKNAPKVDQFFWSDFVQMTDELGLNPARLR
ncbi:MAG: hypothetical protein ACOVP4_13415 [Bacteriovoracaceae bacterium]|jgi:hypothetical protein